MYFIENRIYREGTKLSSTKRKRKKKKSIKKFLIEYTITWVTMAVLLTFYCLAVFTNIPYLSTLRNIWIETAMTTGEHQWLATAFIPPFVIDEVMGKAHKDDDTVSVTMTDIPSEDKDNTKSIDKSADINKEEDNKLDILKQSNLGDTDQFGNKVLVNDKEQGIVITEVKGVGYSGQLVMIDDASRVFVKNTDKKGEQGELILNYLSKYNSIIGINANGFTDTDGVGNGGEIIGRSLSGGQEWGTDPIGDNVTIGFDRENRLVVGKILDWKTFNLRDAVQFRPVLIAHGEIMVTGSDGYGVQPRTIVGQRSDGVVLFLVVDGRQPTHSIGITVGDAAIIMKQYGAVTAAACDGGSSSVLAYTGSIINKPSTPMKTGRYLPNALLVRRK